MRQSFYLSRYFSLPREADMKIDVHFGRFRLLVESSSIPGSEVRVRQTE